MSWAYAVISFGILLIEQTTSEKYQYPDVHLIVFVLTPELMTLVS